MMLEHQINDNEGIFRRTKRMGLISMEDGRERIFAYKQAGVLATLEAEWISDNVI